MIDYSFLDSRYSRTYSIKIITDGYTGLNIESKSIFISPDKLVSNSFNIHESWGNFNKLGLSDKSTLEFDTVSFYPEYIVKDAEIQVFAEVRDKLNHTLKSQMDLGNYFIDEVTSEGDILHVVAYSNHIKYDALPDIEELKLNFIQHYCDGFFEKLDFEYSLPINYLQHEIIDNKLMPGTLERLDITSEIIYPWGKEYYFSVNEYSYSIMCRKIKLNSSTVKEKNFDISNKLFCVKHGLSSEAINKIEEIRYNVYTNAPQKNKYLKIFNSVAVNYGGYESDAFIKLGQYFYLDIPNIPDPFEFYIIIPYKVYVYYDDGRYHSLVDEFYIEVLDLINSSVYYSEVTPEQKMIYRFNEGVFNEKESNSRSEYTLLNDYYELLGEKLDGRLKSINLYWLYDSIVFPEYELFPSNTLYPESGLGDDVQHVPIGLGMQEECEEYSASEEYSSIKYVYFEDEKYVESEVLINNNNAPGKDYDISKNEILLSTTLSDEEMQQRYINKIERRVRNLNSHIDKIHTTLQGLPYLKIGDYISVYTKNGKIKTTLITDITHTGEQGMVTEIDNRI